MDSIMLLDLLVEHLRLFNIYEMENTDMQNLVNYYQLQNNLIY